jgi:hypothetical protein
MAEAAKLMNCSMASPATAGQYYSVGPYFRDLRINPMLKTSIIILPA